MPRARDKSAPMNRLIPPPFLPYDCVPIGYSSQPISLPIYLQSLSPLTTCTSLTTPTPPPPPQPRPIGLRCAWRTPTKKERCFSYHSMKSFVSWSSPITARQCLTDGRSHHSMINKWKNYVVLLDTFKYWLKWNDYLLTVLYKEINNNLMSTITNLIREILYGWCYN